MSQQDPVAEAADKVGEKQEAQAAAKKVTVAATAVKKEARARYHPSAAKKEAQARRYKEALAKKQQEAKAKVVKVQNVPKKGKADYFHMAQGSDKTEADEVAEKQEVQEVQALATKQQGAEAKAEAAHAEKVAQKTSAAEEPSVQKVPATKKAKVVKARAAPKTGRSDYFHITHGGVKSAVFLQKPPTHKPAAVKKGKMHHKKAKVVKATKVPKKGRSDYFHSVHGVQKPQVLGKPAAVKKTKVVKATKVPTKGRSDYFHVTHGAQRKQMLKSEDKVKEERRLRAASKIPTVAATKLMKVAKSGAAPKSGRSDYFHVAHGVHKPQMITNHREKVEEEQRLRAAAKIPTVAEKQDVQAAVKEVTVAATKVVKAGAATKRGRSNYFHIAHGVQKPLHNKKAKGHHKKAALLSQKPKTLEAKKGRTSGCLPEGHGTRSTLEKEG